LNKVVYLQEPGILYDMLFALKLRFNGERAYLPLRTESSFSMQNENFYRLIIDKLADVSDKLLPFFYYDDDRDIATGMFVYVRDYINLTAFQESGLIEYFYSTLRDVNRLKQSIYKNYISDACPDDFDKNTLYTVKDTLLQADLPGDIKMYLLDFLLYGEKQIEEIIAEFKKAEALCRELQQINKSEIEQLFSRFQSEHLQKLSLIHCIDISQYENVYATYCTIIKNVLNFSIHDKSWLSILCMQVSQMITAFSAKNTEFSIYDLGRILYDKQRLKILDLLCKEEMYCAQIAKELGLKSNSTIYHLTMMEQEGVIKNHKLGNKILYSINHKYFYAVKDYITNMLGG